MREDENVPVVLAGGGLVGLAAAAFLARRGIRCLVLEKRPVLSGQPRSRGINPRTMELLRELGLDKQVRAAPSAVALRDNSGVIAMESLRGRELGALRDRHQIDVRADLGELTPSAWCLCHQGELEPLLHERAVELGAEVRFGAEVTGFEQDADGVRVTVAEDQATRTVRARYLIAADGAGSPIRSALGVPSQGEGTLGTFLNIHFRADLREPLAGRRFVMAYTFRPLRTGLMPLDNAEEWLLHAMVDLDAEPAESFTDERCAELVRLVAGIPDLAVEILGARPWRLAATTAGTFRDGRVFLAGDAAHVMPPTGAFGSNTGIADAHNLAWKLAAVLAGAAGPGLLDSYDAERRPLAEATVRQAVLRSRDRPRMADEAAGPADPEIVGDHLIWFGGRQTGPAVLGQERPGWPEALDASPGTRAPHLELPGGPLLDRLGEEFVLLTGPDSEPWLAACAAAPVPVRHEPIGDEAWPRVYRAGAGAAVLVRPDHVVAWRAETLPADPAAALSDALDRILAR